MREIKFRGYNRQKGWIYGMLVRHILTEGYAIGDFDDAVSYSVEEDSIGQYTGFKDKNSKEIYEGDIIKWWNEKCIVEFDAGKWLAKKMTSNKVILLFDELSHIEVIGNTYEEKLKEKERV